MITFPDSKTCALIGHVFSYLESRPDATDRLLTFLRDDQLLYDTAWVAEKTGWSEGHISRLCRLNLLPHIPGNPHKFVLGPLLDAIEKLQVGGIYKKRRKSGKQSAVEIVKKRHGT